MAFGLADDRELEVGDQGVVLGHQVRSTSMLLRTLDRRSAPACLAIGRKGQPPPEGRKVVLRTRVLNMRRAAGPASAPDAAAADEVARRPHGCGLDVGLWQEAARRRLAILNESSLSFLALPPWIAFIASAWPSTNAIPSAAHTTRAIPREHALGGDHRSSRYGPRRRARPRVDGTLRCTSTWPVASRMLTYWSSRGDRSRNSDAAGGCRISSQLSSAQMRA